MKRLTIAVAGLALALAGCGGSSAPSLSAFKSGFESNKASFRQLGVDLQQAIATAQTKSDAQLASEIGALSKRAKQQAESLAKLDPPSRFKAALKELEAAFNSVSNDLTQISTAAARHDGAKARAGTLALIHDASTVKTNDDSISSGLHLPANG